MSQIDDVLLGGSSIATFALNLTPAALAASVGMKEQAFTVNVQIPNLLTTDAVIVSDPPGAVNANCAVVGARVSTAGGAGVAQITLIFANLTAAANVPTAGVHTFVIVRP